jgi:WD repeat-containing protein 23
MFPCSALIGHTEGITYVSSKGDGRYIVSNGKDQAAKLWDLRRMISGAEFDAMEKPNTFIDDWDYRHGTYARPRTLT